MKKLIYVALAAILAMVLINGCASVKQSQKTGDVLWEEYCGRCHNAPASNVYKSEEWEVIGLHMKMRAQIPDDDAQKIIQFLKSKK
jgi:hypothetical protein